MDWDDDSCICCGSLYHWVQDCPLFQRKYGKTERICSIYRKQMGYVREDYEDDETPAYYSHYEPPSSYSEEYSQSNDGYQGYTNQSWQQNYNHDYQIQDNQSNQEVESFQNISLSEEENGLSRFELMLSKIDENLSQHCLSDQQRIDLLRRKCEVLSMKIEFEELFEDKQVKEVMKNYTTSITTVVEEMALAPLEVDDELEEEVINISDQKVECSNLIKDVTTFEEQVIEILPTNLAHHPLNVIQSDKVGNVDSNSKKRKVDVEDITKFVLLKVCNDSTITSIKGKNVRTGHVNYRSYAGNSVGKCGFILSINDSNFMPSMEKQIWSWNVRYRAYVGNVTGKCSLRPP